jgi:predicted RNA-binding Zn ribbon-like protein
MGDVRRMELTGGHVALDFVNTLGGLPDRPDDEYLFNYLDLLDWLARVGLLLPAHHHAMRRAAGETPEEATRVFENVHRLRGSLDQVLRCRLSGASADAGQLGVIRSAYAEAARHATLQEHAESYRLTWSTAGAEALRWPLWVIADASLDLLTDAPLHLLGRCQHCRWLFLDLSRNHSRRWCSMNGCGAIVKMRRHRAARGSRPR